MFIVVRNMQTISGVHRPQQQGTPPIGGPGSAQPQLQQQNEGMQSQQPASGAVPQQGTQAPVDKEKIYQWIVELSSATTRENALLELRYNCNLVLFLVSTYTLF